jgi:hypothetical protein
VQGFGDALQARPCAGLSFFGGDVVVPRVGYVTLHSIHVRAIPTAPHFYRENQREAVGLIERDWP